MYKDIALFLLEHPPLEEIGGSIVDIIEAYRVGTLSKDDAVHHITTTFEPFLKKYYKQKAALAVWELDNM